MDFCLNDHALLATPKTLHAHKHVFVIEDDDSMRRSIQGILEFMGYQVQVFSSALEFIGLPILAAPAVVVTDMRMPNMSGVDLQAHLIQQGRQIPIIFISGESTLAQSITAMKQGAIEFLLKPFDREHLLAAVARGIEIDTQYMQEFLRQQELEEGLKSLSPREVAVFELLSQGYNNAEIVENLDISLPTAKQYKSEVMRKLNLRSLAQLIALRRASEQEDIS